MISVIKTKSKKYVGSFKGEFFYSDCGKIKVHKDEVKIVDIPKTVDGKYFVQQDIFSESI